MKHSILRLRAAAPLALAAGLGALPAYAALPTVPSQPLETAPAFSAGSLAQAAFGMLMVLGLIFLCACLARRFGLQRLRGGGDVVRVVASSSIGQRERIVVVEIGASWVVLGVTPSRINALHTMPAQAGAHAPAPAPAFASTFASVIAPTTTPARTPAPAPEKAMHAGDSDSFDPVLAFAQKLRDSLSGKAQLVQ